MTFFFNSSDITGVPTCLHSRTACDIQNIMRALQNGNQQDTTGSSGNSGGNDGDIFSNPFERTKTTSTSGTAVVGYFLHNDHFEHSDRLYTASGCAPSFIMSSVAIKALSNMKYNQLR
ncbi:hypothetical protein G6F42_022167 [Rhizopus arrhizus]|nr:hypothetical protein G6F42_022167 [Rhizopus arrhizus]